MLPKYEERACTSTASATPRVEPCAAHETAEEAEPQKKRGFWSRVFGIGRDKSDEDRKKEEERRKQEQKKKEDEERKRKSGGR